MSAPDPPRWIAVGVVARPHGVRGELRVRLHNAGSAVLGRVGEVDLEGHGLRRVLSARPQGDAVLLRLDGCATREQADLLRGAAVRVRRDALPEPAADEYYFCDLIGLEVQDPEGRVQGRVRDVVEGPGHAVLTVAAADGRDIEVPLAEDWVVSVEISAGKIVIRDLDALA